jgi:pimeloyl-ACP methyl ester carboxylesterase
MQLLRRLSKVIFLPVLISILLILFIPSRTSPIDGDNSLAYIQGIKLGGVKQYIMVRGKDINNPILLFLHGGPGYAQISFASKYQSELEDHFIVVNWDQRGAGKSYSTNIPKESMTREQFIKDGIELINYLTREYGKEKVILVGHSWGSDLGLHIVNQYSEKITAFVSVGQVISGQKQEKISYEYVMEMAKGENNQKAIQELTSIGHPPYSDMVRDINTQRKWLAHYGGVERKVNTLRDIITASIISKEYTGIDGIKFAIGSRFTADAMWGNNMDLDFIRDLSEVKVPIYFCAGRYDYNTPSILIQEYYNHIIAPEKELIWFEESAHFPHFEEPEKFAELLLKIKNKKENFEN